MKDKKDGIDSFISVMTIAMMLFFGIVGSFVGGNLLGFGLIGYFIGFWVGAILAAGGFGLS